MKVIWEEFDGELFIEIYMDHRDREHFRDGDMVCRTVKMRSQNVTIGVIPLELLTTEEEEQDAIEEGEE